MAGLSLDTTSKSLTRYPERVKANHCHETVRLIPWFVFELQPYDPPLIVGSARGSPRFPYRKALEVEGN